MKDNIEVLTTLYEEKGKVLKTILALNKMLMESKTKLSEINAKIEKLENE